MFRVSDTLTYRHMFFTNIACCDVSDTDTHVSVCLTCVCSRHIATGNVCVLRCVWYRHICLRERQIHTERCVCMRSFWFISFFLCIFLSHLSVSISFSVCIHLSLSVSSYSYLSSHSSFSFCIHIFLFLYSYLSSHWSFCIHIFLFLYSYLSFCIFVFISFFTLIFLFCIFVFTSFFTLIFLYSYLSFCIFPSQRWHCLLRSQRQIHTERCVCMRSFWFISFCLYLSFPKMTLPFVVTQRNMCLYQTHVSCCNVPVAMCLIP